MTDLWLAVCGSVAFGLGVLTGGALADRVVRRERMRAASIASIHCRAEGHSALGLLIAYGIAGKDGAKAGVEFGPDGRPKDGQDQPST